MILYPCYNKISTILVSMVLHPNEPITPEAQITYLIKCAWVFATRRSVTTIETQSCAMESYLLLRHCLDRTLVLI